MEEHISLVTRKGQITLPAELRRLLGIREGDKVAVTLGDPAKGEIVVRPVRSVAEATFGAVTPRQRPEDWQELRQRFEDVVVKEALSETEPAQQP
jgi:AbrB family looped-hinge helix DNA binding protein